MVLNLNDYLPQLQELAKESDFCELHRATMVDCSSERLIEQLENDGHYSGPATGWQVTSSDYWYSRIDAMVEEAAEADDPLALEINTLQHMAFDLMELGHEELAEPLLSKVEELSVVYHPTGAEGWFPRHRCHDTVALQYVIARRILPKQEWWICTNATHSWVESTEGDIIDFMLFEEPPLDWYALTNTERFPDLEGYQEHLLNYTEAA